ncbi:MAG: flavodoxin domain-containing protein [Parasphingorhabdus sp.]
MDGAIFYATRYGSTAQYAEWISEATGISSFDVNRADADPSHYDFVVIGAPVIYHKLAIRNWVRQKMATLKTRPVLFFTVSGAPAGSKLDGWIANSLPRALIERMHHFALLGRQNPGDLSWFDRMMLIIGGLKNRDRVAGKEELEGFDFMDKASIQPIVKAIQQLQSSDGVRN